MAESFAFDPLDPAVRREPWALYARGPIHTSPVFRGVTSLPVRLSA